MSLIAEDKDRKIIPRWRTFDQTLCLGELRPHQVSPSKPITDLYFPAKLSDWQRHHTLKYAVELVGSALVLNRSHEVVDAAEFIVAQTANAPPAAIRLAERALERKAITTTAAEDLSSGRTLAALRKRVRDEPRNALCWIDLSLHYAYIGKLESARHAMKVGEALAPNDRFVLRSAARFYVHVGDPEHAHFLLDRAPATETDPWLVAAEIAVSSVLKRTSGFINTARDQLVSKAFGPWHVSELD